jgi:hypothetical protein
MSHVATVDVKITDLNAIKKACEKLGFAFKEGQKTYRWFGQWVDDSPVPESMFETAEELARVRAMPREERKAYMTARLGKCAHAISIPGAAYEIGLRPNSDGSYTLAFDWYGQTAMLNALGGAKAPKLVQGYATEKMIIEATRLGHAVESQETLANGDIRLRVLAAR